MAQNNLLLILTHLTYIANGKKRVILCSNFTGPNKRDVTLRKRSAQVRELLSNNSLFVGQL